MPPSGFAAGNSPLEVHVFVDVVDAIERVQGRAQDQHPAPVVDADGRVALGEVVDSQRRQRLADRGVPKIFISA